MRTIYFDIDGVLLDYNDKPMAALVSSGALQAALHRLDVDALVCLSGWSDLVNTPSPFQSPLAVQKAKIAALLQDLFPDRDWFMSRLALRYDTDSRCQHIDVSINWFYLDDWADQFFIQQFGHERYQQEQGRRVLRVNPHGDGTDILEWLETVVSTIEGSD